MIIATAIQYKTGPDATPVDVTTVAGASLTMSNDTGSAIMKVSLSVSFIGSLNC